MALNYFTFGDFQSLKDCGLYIEKRPARLKPRRDVSAHQVPGRDGDVLIDNGRWESVLQRYQVGCSDIDGNIDKINEMLCRTGMLELSDTYDPTYYRKASCINAAEFSEDLLNFGHATVEFTCDPYRYLREGDKTISVGSTITNPTSYTSLPLFTITTYGEITMHLNSKNYHFSSPNGFIYVDCETMQIFKNTSQNYNHLANFDVFPEFLPGKNTIAFTCGQSYQVSVKPRWRKI